MATPNKAKVPAEPLTPSHSASKTPRKILLIVHDGVLENVVSEDAVEVCIIDHCTQGKPKDRIRQFYDGAVHAIKYQAEVDPEQLMTAWSLESSE